MTEASATHCSSLSPQSPVSGECSLPGQPSRPVTLHPPREAGTEKAATELRLAHLPTSAGYTRPSTVCSEPRSSVAPQWKWNCFSL